MNVETVAADLRAHGDIMDPAEVYFRIVEGWTFGFSALNKGENAWICIFSACLFPRGRGSIEADWSTLGAICAALPMPPAAMEQIRQQAEHGDPNGVMKAVWTEKR